jgi:hypothetical protein
MKLAIISAHASPPWVGRISIPASTCALFIGRRCFGPDRACQIAPQHLVSDGLIILDNSEVTHYADGTEWLGDQILQRVDFRGPSPGARYVGFTSFFTRPLKRCAFMFLSPPPVRQRGEVRFRGCLNSLATQADSCLKAHHHAEEKPGLHCGRIERTRSL